MWFGRRKKLDPALVSELESLDSESANLKLREAVETKRHEVAVLRENRHYADAGSSVRARIDARREARGDAQRRQAAHVKADAEKRRQTMQRHLVQGLEGSEGLALCTAAIACERPGTSARAIAGRIGESMCENVGMMPFSYDFLTTAFRSLYQVQGLIREMYPYKSTVIRYIQTLDFTRWACRVLYSECPTAQGLIRAKTAFIIRRGNKVNLVRKDKGNEISEVQRKGQWFIDRFLEENDWAEKERERYRRRCLDGEAFTWTADPDKPAKETDQGKGDGTGACVAAFIEPDFIRPSEKKFQSQEDPHMVGATGKSAEDWSFGILTPHHRYYHPLAYNVVWNDNEESVIPAAQMVHSAERERSNMKRCLPPLLLSSDDLIRMTLLRSCLAESSRYRAAVAGVVEYEEASGVEIEQGDDIYGRSLQMGGSEDESWEMRQLKIEGGSYLLELPPGRKFSIGPVFPPGDSLTLVYDWHIRAIAQQWGVPEWVVKGASAGSSFSDSLTAESPSVVEFELEQSRECGYTKRSVTRELQYRIDNDQLPADFFEQFSVEVQSDSVITRDSKSETETAIMSVEKQLCSRETAQTTLGFDPGKESKLIEQEKALGVGPVWSKTPQMEQAGNSGPEETGGGPEKVDESPETVGGQRQKLEGERVGESTTDANGAEHGESDGKFVGNGGGKNKIGNSAPKVQIGHPKSDGGASDVPNPEVVKRAREAHGNAIEAFRKAGISTDGIDAMKVVTTDNPKDAGAIATGKGFTVKHNGEADKEWDSTYSETIQSRKDGEVPGYAFQSDEDRMIHEIGHNLMRKLSQADQTELEQIYKNNAGSVANLPSFFAQENSSEMFAESVLAIIKGYAFGERGKESNSEVRDFVRKHLGMSAVGESTTDGQWVTISGAHVFIDGTGKITKGPAHFIGKTHEEAIAHKGGGEDTEPKGKSEPKKKPEPKQPAAEEPEAEEPESEDADDEPVKRPAVPKGEPVSAKREGKGKDAKIVMSDDSEAPPHITPAMIPPAWENVQVYPDPDSEVWVKATMTAKSGKTSGKAVYKPSYSAEMASAKFTRVNVMQSEIGEIDSRIQADRADPKTRDAADVAFLMREQATRPGSEADTKGTEKLYGVPLTAANVIVTPAKPNKSGKVTGKPKVEIEVKGERVHIRDAGAAEEVQRRVAAGESLEDSTYWLKSHGATTLEGRHVVEAPDGVRLQFMGKEGVWHDHLVENPELSKMLTERKKAAGNTGKLFNVNDSKAAAYVKSLDHGRLSPKDLRTNRANEIAAAEVKKFKGPAKDAAEAKARKMQVATTVSRKLGNRPAQAIESYIDPAAWNHPAFEGAA